MNYFSCNWEMNKLNCLTFNKKKIKHIVYFYCDTWSNFCGFVFCLYNQRFVFTERKRTRSLMGYWEIQNAISDWIAAKIKGNFCFRDGSVWVSLKVHFHWANAKAIPFLDVCRHLFFDVCRHSKWTGDWIYEQYITKSKSKIKRNFSLRSRFRSV